jgi:undecaprenyl-diphosphatase
MEEILRAVALGVLQGLTEFLPISSSGHLIVARELFDWEFTDDLTFDVALHLGTTVAVVSFFSREWLQMLRRSLAWAAHRPQPGNPGSIYDHRLLLRLAIGSVPVSIAGLAFGDVFGEEVRSPLVVGAMFVLFGLVLLAMERSGSRGRSIGHTCTVDALLVGVAQALSLIPGVSRAGVTISAGLWRGFTRVDAARFSFLLSTPAVVGASALTLGEAIAEGIPAQDIAPIAAGAAVSAFVGWLCIGYLVRLVQTRSYLPFVVYRLAAGAFVLVYFAP